MRQSKPETLNAITIFGMKVIKPYGSWASPISSELLTSAQVSIAELCFTNGHLY